MGIDTPNLLSRETTFLMGILKKCLSVEKTPNEPNNQISSIPVSGHSVPLTEEDPLMPVEGDPLMSMEGVFSHSVTSHGRCISPFSSAHRRKVTYVHGRQISNELCQHL